MAVPAHGERRFDVFRTDSAALQQLAKLFFGKKRVATKRIGPFDNRTFKRQMFECMQRVVMYERRDRPLRRQQMGGVFNYVPQVGA